MCRLITISGWMNLHQTIFLMTYPTQTISWTLYQIQI
ncbi:hypothetical protein GDO86_013510 [Hymenochirus boettgeri]|uniref:Uncharacterized protein n=1 Tax=Hymenochirus boettgeri TaxID=247094 RepID=A0A8T2IZM9_9PIPI|nr:hypothetical protein GDO86_013510 [Hymenochirus boettgeri]